MHSMSFIQKSYRHVEDGRSHMKNSGSDDSRLEQMRNAIDKIDEKFLKINESVFRGESW